MHAIVPISKVDLSIRVATMADLPFMDGLQKKHSKALGFFPRAQMEGYVEAGNVLVAWAPRPCSTGETPVPREEPVGYCVSKDRYLKRDELGVIFQLCVEPGVQRKLVGAALVQAVFERSAYGCRLYCCWCAQDLEANHFWESMGFVPIAFRAGSTGKKRVHIFWQKRIVEGDTETKWWYPSQTSSGAIRADRLVFPIPSGLHWSDEMPMLQTEQTPQQQRAMKGLPDPGTPAQPQKPTLRPRQRVQFRPPARERMIPQTAPAPPAPAPSPPSPKKPPAAKIDPKLLAAARELRDRYLEHVNTPGAVLNALPAQAKYTITRQIAQAPAQAVRQKQLPEAA